MMDKNLTEKKNLACLKCFTPYDKLEKLHQHHRCALSYLYLSVARPFCTNNNCFVLFALQENRRQHRDECQQRVPKGQEHGGRGLRALRQCHDDGPVVGQRERRQRLHVGSGKTTDKIIPSLPHYTVALILE